MSTEAGTHHDFGALLAGLLSLEFETQAAFECAAQRVDSATYRAHLDEFIATQRQHIEGIKALLEPLAPPVAQTHQTSELLHRARVMLANLAGDRAVMHALTASLDDLNAAYGRAITHDAVTPEALGILQGHFLDERRHRRNFERFLNPEAQAVAADEIDLPPELLELRGSHPVSFQPPQAR